MVGDGEMKKFLNKEESDLVVTILAGVYSELVWLEAEKCYVLLGPDGFRRILTMSKKKYKMLEGMLK